MNVPSITPAQRYKNCQEAITWLCDNLGFSKVVVHESDGVVHHALLRIENGMIMISSSGKSDFDQYVCPPSELGNKNTQSAYIYIPKIEEHYKQILNKKVEVVLPMTEEPHGKGFTCRDPEGYLWSFGNYNPWDNI